MGKQYNNKILTNTCFDLRRMLTSQSVLCWQTPNVVEVGEFSLCFNCFATAPSQLGDKTDKVRNTFFPPLYVVEQTFMVLFPSSRVFQPSKTPATVVRP